MYKNFKYFIYNDKLATIILQFQTWVEERERILIQISKSKYWKEKHYICFWFSFGKLVILTPLNEHKFLKTKKLFIQNITVFLIALRIYNIFFSLFIFLKKTKSSGSGIVIILSSCIRFLIRVSLGLIIKLHNINSKFSFLITYVWEKLETKKYFDNFGALYSIIFFFKKNLFLRSCQAKLQ